MKLLYALFAVILFVVALFTGEIVTFIMLGFILMVLHNILDVLVDIRNRINK